MVQQNLVSYILSQMRSGKSMQEINEFLLSAGYDKQEVESSVQYVINTQTNPEVAEDQRIEQLAGYIKTQLGSGYDQRTISNFLISRGYPYFEVNSAFQRATEPRQAMRTEHKLLVFALVAMFVMTSLVSVFYFSSLSGTPPVPEKLLDVETEQLTTLVRQGGDLSFEVGLINFGYEQRFDVQLKYQVIDRDTQNVVLEKDETVALSTTLQRVVDFDIPDSIKPGRYVLRTDAIYGDFVATSGFIFDIVRKDIADEKIEEIISLMPDEDESDIPELSDDDVELPSEDAGQETEVVSEDVPVIVKGAEEPRFFEGLTKQQSFELVKRASHDDLGSAVEMCQEYTYRGTEEECITELAVYSEDGHICDSITRDARKDSCYLDVARSTGDYDWCALISNSGVQQSCNMFSVIDDVQAVSSPATSGSAGEVDQDELFSLVVKAQS